MKMKLIMVTVTINGTPRTDVGKKATKADRNAERIPCVMYGSGDGGNIHFTTSYNEVRDMIYSSDFKIAEVNLNGNTYKCIVKDIQFHPVKDHIIHLDFQQLAENRSIKVDLPLRFYGISPGVRAGGKLFQKIRTIKVKTTPEALVDEIAVDISDLKLGQSLRVRDIKLIPGVEFLTPSPIPVASVEIPRGLGKEAEEAPAAAEAPVETAAEAGTE